MLRSLLACFGAGLLIAVHSQESDRLPFTLTETKKTGSSSASNQKIGKSASDILPGNGTRGGYTLRNAPVIEGSESVYHEGRLLTRDVHYWIDYGSGNISFMEPIKRFSSVSISYRYDPQAPRSDSAGALPFLSLSFGQTGGIQTMMRMGQAETAKDGSVWQTNTYGLQNAFKFGQGSSIEGFYFMSARKQVHAFDAPTVANASAPKVTAGSQEQFLVQRMQFNERGVQFGFQFQDIGQGFSAAKALQGQANLSPEQIAAWEKEKGLKRVGYQFGLNLGQGASVEHSVSQIRNGDQQIQTRSLGFNSKAISLNWNRREADKDFKRFKDLSEGERNDWERERGLAREAINGQINFGQGSLLKADMNQIEDLGGKIHLRAWQFESKTFKFNRKWQRVEQGFARFNDLAEAEKGQWARERGMTRDLWNAEFSVSGLQLSASQSDIGMEDGGYHREHYRAAGSNWRAEHLERKVDAQFARLQDLKPEEHAHMALETRQFYEPAVQAVNDQERAQSVKERGLGRVFQQAHVSPAKDTKVEFKKVAVQNLSGAGDMRNVQWNFTSPVLQFRMMNRAISDDFERIGDLTPYERGLVANERGMKRLEWGGGLTFKQFGVAYSQTNVNTLDSGLQKSSFRLLSPKFEVTYNTRRVDEEFHRFHDLADPERNLLAQLRGFSQYDWNARAQVMRGLTLENYQFDARNPSQEIVSQRNRFRFHWQPSQFFQIGHLQDRADSVKPEERLLNDAYARDDAEWKMRYGHFNAYQEKRQIGGTLAQPLYQKTDYWKYQGQNFRNLNLIYEQRDTNAQGAISENFQFYQVHYQVGARMKLITNEAILNREGAPDETNRQMGFEYTLKPGAVFSFSENRKLIENANGTRVMSVGLSQTSWGGLNFSGTYQEWRADRVNNKSQSGVSVQTAKPMRFLFLTNLEFTYSYGALHDNKVWHQENKRLQLKANLGSNSLETAYVGVYVPGQGRAADRVYKLASDRSPKNPLQYSFSYKVRTFQGGTEQMIRDYNVTYKPSKQFEVAHEFRSFPEQANPQVVLGSLIVPTGFSNWTMNWVWSPRLSLRGDYRIDWDDKQNRRVRRGGFSFIGNSSANLLYAVGYRVDSETFHSQKRTGHTFFVNTERKLNADHFLVLGLEWTHFEHRTPQEPKRDIQRLTCELRRVF